MSFDDGIHTLFLAFIKDEDDGLNEGRQRRFWASNHHRIEPRLRKAEVVLYSTELRRLYLHVLRMTGKIPPVSKATITSLIDAYGDLLPLIDGESGGLARRHRLLFVFGFDESGELPSGKVTNLDALRRRHALLTHLDRFVHLPGMRAKAATFVAYDDLAVPCLETFRHLGYRFDRRYGSEASDTTFWGMSMVVLQSEATRIGMVRDLLGDVENVPERQSRISILNEMLGSFSTEDAAFATLVEEVAAIHAARRADGEAVRLSGQLGFGLPETKEWSVGITIPIEGNAGNPYDAPNLTLGLSSNPDWPWQVNLRADNGRRFAEWDGRVTQDDLGIPQLGSGRLADFPRWVAGLKETCGLTVLVDQAVVLGVKGKAKGALLDWLRGRPA